MSASTPYIPTPFGVIAATISTAQKQKKKHTAENIANAILALAAEVAYNMLEEPFKSILSDELQKHPGKEVENLLLLLEESPEIWPQVTNGVVARIGEVLSMYPVRDEEKVIEQLIAYAVVYEETDHVIRA